MKKTKKYFNWNKLENYLFKKIKILSFLILFFITILNSFGQNTNVIAGWNYGNGKVMYCGMGYMMHPAAYHGDFFQHDAEKQLFVNMVRKTSSVANPIVGIFAVSGTYSNIEDADTLIAILARNGISGVIVTAAMIDTQAEIDNFDVLILGGSGQHNSEFVAGYADVQSVVKNFVLTHQGGVIFTGWSVYTISGLALNDFADMIPVNTSSNYSYSSGYSLVKVLPADALYTGVGSLASTGYCEYPTAGVKPGATVYGTITTYVPSNIPADPSSVSISVNPVCNGEGTQLTANGAEGTVYWYTSSCGGTQLTIGNTITVNPTITTTYYARNYNNSEYSNGCASITVTVYNVLTAGISGTISPICYNTSPGTFTATASGGTGTYSYLWYKDGISTGVTTQTYVPGNLTNTSEFFCAVSSGSCGTVNTDTTTIIVKLNPSIADAGSNQEICNATSAILAGNTPVIGTGNWAVYTDPYMDITSISLPQSPTATAYGLKNGRSYTFAWIISNAPCASSTDYITVSIDASSVGGSLSGTDTTTYGSATGIMTLNGYTGNIQKWQKKLNNGNWTDILNTNTTYSEIPSTAGNWYYRAIVKNGSCLDAASDSFMLTVYKKTLAITADNKTKDYDGLAYSPFTVTYNGFVLGDSFSSLGGILTFSGSAATATDIGTYSIIPSGQISANYIISYFNGLLTVNCAAQVNVSNNQNSGYGSLRNAIANLCDNGTITFNAINGQTIGLTSGTLIIDKNLIFNNSNHTSGFTISGSGDNITIYGGNTLTLASGSKITVMGNINFAAYSPTKPGFGLVVASGASFIHNIKDLPATVQRYLNTNWHLFGSPFKKNAGAVLGNITAVGGNTQMKPFTNGSNWGSNITSSIYPLLPTVGYAIKTNLPFTAALSGNLYYSPMVFDYTNSLVYNGTSASQSWNLVANPYTSYLDWNLLGKTNLNATLYLWDNTLYPNSTPLANASYMRTFNSCNNVGVPAGSSRFIAPLQGFFVKAVYANPRLTFPPSARTHASAPYYKDASNTTILVRLKAETEAGVDELVICKNQDAKSDFEQFDSEKMLSDLPLQIYSQSSTGEQLIINTINAADNKSIPLGIIGNAGAKTRITAFALETTEQLYLEDRLKGKMISLSEGTTYDFVLPTDVITGRFFIRFGNNNILPTTSDVKIFESDNVLNIIAQTGENIEQVEVFTITGARVYKTESGSNMLTAKLDLTAGVYLVRVRTNVGTQNVKINWK